MQLGSRAYTGTTESRWIDDPVLGLMLSTNGTDSKPTLSDHQLYTLRSIAISAACMSMASGMLVGWWFVRMKRSFRHQYVSQACLILPSGRADKKISLIMLMIFSDFFKASWQLIYPAVVFTRGEIPSRSRFCQTSGFMMSMGIEASDFAVLAIAVHSALYIFRPGMVRVGEGGLYRYRYYVYTAWLAFTIIMPSLAFLNQNPAYSAQVTFCYLPIRYMMDRATIPI
jgi:G protein-coupled receptor GPR1